MVEKLIIPPAFRGNFQQPLAPLIESATVSISTHHAIKGHPAYHTQNIYERVVPGIADDEAYSDLCTIIGKLAGRLEYSME